MGKFSFIVVAFFFVHFVCGSQSAHTAEVQGTAYPCRVQLLPHGYAKARGFGNFGAVKVEFWTEPACGGDFCGKGFFMSDGATQFPTSTVGSYANSEAGVMTQYLALVELARTERLVWWSFEASMYNPQIYELKAITPSGPAICKNVDPDRVLPVTQK